MTNIFISVVNMSITASILVLLVLLLRLVLKKAPRWISVLLWGLVAVRLVCPITLESHASVMPDREWVEVSYVEESYSDAITPDVIIPSQNDENQSVTYTQNEPEITVKRGLPTSFYFSTAWLFGIAIMLLYTLASYLVLCRRVKTAIHLKENIFQSENVSSPFVLGVIRPRIYLPFGIDSKALEYVIAHERAHIRHCDHLWKPLGFLLLTLHWFNPIMWLAYILFCRDIESACDEHVVKEMNTLERADYSEALLLCSVKRRSISACPLAFGETGVKSRVKSVLSYKKPAFWVILTSLILCIAAAVAFLTDPVSDKERAVILADKIIGRDGYTVIDQRFVDVTLGIHNSRIMPAVTGDAEYEFKSGERIAYQQEGTQIYLKRISQVPSDNGKLLFTFDFEYDFDESCGIFLCPWTITENDTYLTVFSVQDGYLYGNPTDYKNAVLEAGQGPDREISVYISKDALQHTESGGSKFIVTLNQTTYLKDYERRTLLEEEILNDAERVASISGYSFIGGRLRYPEENKAEAVFSNRDGSVYVGVTYVNDNGWILDDNPIREYHNKDLTAALVDRFPAIEYYAVGYAAEIGDRISEEQHSLYNGSRASTITELERLSTVAVDENGRVELYYMTYWIGKGINGPTGPVDEYKTFSRYFAMYVDAREEIGEILRLGDIGTQQFNDEYNNEVMKSRYGDEYTAAAMKLYENYKGEPAAKDYFENAVLDAYNEATEASHWFRIGTLPPRDMEDFVDIGDVRYYKTSRFETYHDLREYLKYYFSVSIVDELLSGDNYIDYNGKLYSTVSGRGGNISMGRESYSITRENENKYILEVTVEVYGNDGVTIEGYEKFIFTYERISGTWRFTTFPSIR